MSKILLIGPEPDKMPRLKMTYKSLKSLGHDVKVFAPFERKGNTVMRYLANMVKLLFERSENYHYFNIPDVIGLPLLLKRGRLIYDVRSPWKEVMQDSTGNKYLAKFAEIVERIFCLKADAVVSANPLLAERAKSYGAKEVVNVPNFLYEELSTDGWEEADDALRMLYEKEQGIVLYFGKISIPEGSNVLADVIIETLKFEHDAFDVRFLIIGDGPELENLKEKVHNAGVMNRVMFLGWIPHKNIGKWIKAANMCIMPREEGGTTKWMHPDCIWKVNEAVSIGTPVLATMYGGFNYDTAFMPLTLTRNKDYPIAIMNILDVALRWGDECKFPVERSWKTSRDELRKVYGDAV